MLVGRSHRWGCNRSCWSWVEMRALPLTRAHAAVTKRQTRCWHVQRMCSGCSGGCLRTGVAWYVPDGVRCVSATVADPAVVHSLGLSAMTF